VNFVVANKPYMAVRGGDISAGARMSVGGAACNIAPNPNAGIAGWNRGNGGAFGGSGTQYAGLTLGRLQEFATGQGDAAAPAGLSFANNADGDVRINDGVYGGRFGSFCGPDYFMGVPAAQISSSDVTLAGLAVPDCDGTNQAQCRREIYVRGDVYITGNVTFDGTYANGSAIPGFRLVVEGDIYVDPAVTRLDGVYIAQSSSAAATDGRFYSCAAGFAPTTLSSGLNALCGNPLTVNGAVSARQVWLLRTAGTVSNAVVAETFNFLPEIWMSSAYGQSGSGAIKSYDAITSLPPVL